MSMASITAYLTRCQQQRNSWQERQDRKYSLPTDLDPCRDYDGTWTVDIDRVMRFLVDVDDGIRRRVANEMFRFERLGGKDVEARAVHFVYYEIRSELDATDWTGIWRALGCPPTRTEIATYRRDLDGFLPGSWWNKTMPDELNAQYARGTAREWQDRNRSRYL